MKQIMMYFNINNFEPSINRYLSLGYKLVNITPKLSNGTTDGYNVLLETDSSEVIYSSEWRREDIENTFEHVLQRAPSDEEIDEIIEMIDWDAIDGKYCEYTSEDIYGAVYEYNKEREADN